MSQKIKFLEFLKSAHVDNVFQLKNLTLIIIFYYIFNYTKNLDFISFSKNNLNSVISIQNCFKNFKRLSLTKGETLKFRFLF